jgi:hypothetical protein
METCRHLGVRNGPPALLLGGFLLCLAASLPSSRAEDRIILRNLNVITGKTVVGFDEDGVRLDDGTRIGWDEIERGRVRAEQQAAFDRTLEELGEPLYRIRQRLTVGDYPGLLTHAEAVYGRYVRRRSPTAYMVAQALMWARTAVGRREEAVEPYLRCYTYLRSLPESQVDLPGRRRLRFDGETGMSPELIPVWFDSQAAGSALPGVLATISEMPPPRPEGTRVYYGTLALASGSLDRGASVLGGMQGGHPVLAELRDIGLAQREVTAGRPGPAVSQLAGRFDRLTPANKPLAIYWLGMARATAPQETAQREGVLELLHLPALYGRQYPELAAAALFQAMESLTAWGDESGRRAVRRELLDQYRQTYHAARVAAELSPKQDD